VPQGAAEVTYSVGGEQHQTTGVGYHDHNWGNVALMKIVHDWYWARGQAGPYSVIASYITAAEQYGFEPIPIFMLARDNVLVGDDPAKVTFEREGVYTEQATASPSRRPRATPTGTARTGTWCRLPAPTTCRRPGW